MFEYLGFTPEEAKAQFGFLMDAFQYGAPPHGGIAFGLDRLVSILGGQETIRDFIAFPKNNSGRDVMINAPAYIDDQQLKDLNLRLNNKINMKYLIKFLLIISFIGLCLGFYVKL